MADDRIYAILALKDLADAHTRVDWLGSMSHRWKS